MTSITILQADRSALVATLKKLKQTYKEVGADLQPQFQWKVFAAEEAVAAKDAELDTFKKTVKAEVRDERLEEKEEVSETHKWAAFKNALSVYDENGMCFHKNSQPRYFYKKSYQDYDIKTQKAMPLTTELLMFTPASLDYNWPELESKTAQQFLKYMVHGQSITVKDPTAETPETFKFNRRVYTKLGNTRHTPDPETYNMIDLSNIMKPTAKGTECPAIIRQLLLAMSGNVEVDGVLSKPENLEWLEKWLYGVLVADIGNNMLSMPVFFGSGKVGKNAMFDKIFPRVLGTEQTFTGLWANLDGSFTGFKLGKVFIYLDEIPPRDDWNKLKNLTGSPKDLVKMKYGPEFVIENTTALAIGTNELIYPLPLEDGRQMSRVSPIQTDKASTFAENAAKYFEAIEPGMMAQVLESQDIGIEDFKDDLYELGDKFLRNNEELWCGEDQVQELLNYLHGKFADETYTLTPLRGKDWLEITRSRPNPLAQVVEYVVTRNIEVISTTELHEIYKVITGDKKEYTKGIKNFGQLISPMLKDVGFDRKHGCRVIVDPTTLSALKQLQVDGIRKDLVTQATVYHKTDCKPDNHRQSVDDYIFEERIGSSVIRVLKY